MKSSQCSDYNNTKSSFPKGIAHSMEASSYRQTQGSMKNSTELSPEKGTGEEYLVRGSGMCVTLGATTTKRFIMYRRDWCGIICEVIVPIIMVIIGLQFAT